MTINSENIDYCRLKWIQFKDGDKEAFAFFYNMYIDSLFNYGLKICSDEDTVKDAMQEIFIDLYLNREKNKTSPENLKYYLFLALKRNLVKRLQKNRKFETGNPAFKGTDDIEFSIEYELIEKEQQEEIQKKVINALNQLPDRQKEAIYLRFNEALDYAEIANILGITIESVRKQVYRALKTVRELIDNESDVILLHFFQRKIKKSVHI